MNGTYRAIWLSEDESLEVIDQRTLPHRYETMRLHNTQETVFAIKEMVVRGAGTIGCVAAFGVYLSAQESGGEWKRLEGFAAEIRESRPTAVNLMWAVDRMMNVLESSTDLVNDARREAIAISDEESDRTSEIGRHGADLIEKVWTESGGETVDLLTHCNAGWLAVVNDGTALAPVYEAQKRGIDVHVWVDETRPRNQGASLTAWELAQAGVAHTIIADNTGGHLMQHGMVDLVITGADRVSRQGDAANKIGTYLKALAADANAVPFYIALPASTFDFTIIDGLKEIEIEERSEDEVHFMHGLLDDGSISRVRVTPEGSKALNIGFDVTPHHLITGLITERGLCEASLEAVETMFKDLL